MPAALYRPTTGQRSGNPHLNNRIGENLNMQEELGFPDREDGSQQVECIRAEHFPTQARGARQKRLRAAHFQVP